MIRIHDSERRIGYMLTFVYTTSWVATTFKLIFRIIYFAVFVCLRVTYFAWLIWRRTKLWNKRNKSLKKIYMNNRYVASYVLPPSSFFYLIIILTWIAFLLICNNTKDLNAHKLQRIGTLDTVLVFAKPCNLSDKEWQEVKERKLHYYSLPRKTIDVQLLPNN